MTNCSWVGIDLHRRRSHIATIDADGTQVLSRRITNDPQTFLELLAEIDGESKIAVEATCGWEWLADVLEEAGYELHLAHPLRTRAIAAARVKTDSVDARTLAQAAARGSAARSLRGPARAARPAPPPRRADADARGTQEPRPRPARQARDPHAARRPVRRRRPRVPRSARPAPARA